MDNVIMMDNIVSINAATHTHWRLQMGGGGPREGGRGG